MDQASSYIIIQPQISFSSLETLQAKLTFERMCPSNSVNIITYMSDNSTAFTSNEFVSNIINHRQDTWYRAVGAHQHNSASGWSIMTFLNMSRTMMLYTVVHWPDMADSSLWHLGMEHAAYIYNHTPKMGSGIASVNIFTSTSFS